ncbi:MAG TPA: hypothetical protein VGJ27_12425 [Gaiellaceae bacterium]|jgi:hypothetical protein
MSRRIFKTLMVATVVGLAYPVQAAVAKQVDDQMVAAVQTSSSPIVSEKTAGLFQATQSTAPIVSEKLAGLTPVVQPVSSTPIVSEKTTGLVQPFTHSEQPVLISTSDNSFDWSDAGIGAGALLGTMLVGAAGALTLRRHRGTLAH